MKGSCFTLIAAALMLSCFNEAAQAQADSSKIELGVQFTAIRFQDITIPDASRSFFFTRTFNRTEPGFGGRVTYNFTGAVALDGELNYFPRDDADSGGRKSQGLLGVKAGRRTERFGLFGKARPGFVRFNQSLDCPRGNPFDCSTSGKTEFALDLGGVVELYPSRRAVVRFDFGNTLIFYKFREFVIAIDEPGGPVGRRLPLAGETKSNLQFSIGVGVRF
ncbi:MAG TPA: outer membrane beta-barrel protein [Blastocatellia bacterium]|nr:outer membrane beta-barrel protein [Blastocatellia bacterium]